MGQGEVHPVQGKVEAIKRFPVPTTKKDLMRFLGLAGFYCGFFHNYSTVAASLTELLKTKTKFIWSAECQSAFEAIKSLLCDCPVLAAPQFKQPFKLHVDVSNVRAGAALLQEDESGTNRAISFFSRKSNSYQLTIVLLKKRHLL